MRLQGRLPCDADLLRDRARTLQLLDPLMPRLRLRQLLAATPHTVLAHDPQLLLSRATAFAALLPMYDTTHVLMTVMPHLDRDPLVTAANIWDLDDVFGRAFGGALVPPSVFAHILRAPGATLLPPPPPSQPPTTLQRPQARLGQQHEQQRQEPQQQPMQATAQQEASQRSQPPPRLSTSLHQAVQPTPGTQRRLESLIQQRRHVNPAELLGRLQVWGERAGTTPSVQGLLQDPK
jgi:hypothetical protein